MGQQTSVLLALNVGPITTAITQFKRQIINTAVEQIDSELGLPTA